MPTSALPTNHIAPRDTITPCSLSHIKRHHSSAEEDGAMNHMSNEGPAAPATIAMTAVITRRHHTAEEGRRSNRNKRHCGQGGTGLVHDQCYDRHKHPHRKHPERPERIHAIINHLETIGMLKRCVLLPAVEASYDELVGVHNQHYLQRLRKLEHASLDHLVEEAEQYDSVYLNESTIDCAKKAAGGLMGLVKEVVAGRLKNGVALIRPPGHHAEAHHARGFCVINNIAVAAQYARRQLGVSRILICDFDIHHGCGTQRIFLEDPSVLYFSVHRYDQGRFFPTSTDGSHLMVGKGEGAGYTINVAWESPGMGDAEYMEVWRRVLMPVAKAHRPEIVLVSAGFDGALGDEIGGCRITPGCYGEMIRQLMTMVEGGRVVLALEGGYKLSILPKCIEACLEALMMMAGSSSASDTSTEEQEENDGLLVAKKRMKGNGAVAVAVAAGVIVERLSSLFPSSSAAAILPEALLSIERTLEIHRKYWPCLRTAGSITSTAAAAAVPGGANGNGATTEEEGGDDVDDE